MHKTSATLVQPTKGIWVLDVSGLFEYIAGMCEEVLEMACFGPYDKPCSPL